VTVEYLDLGDYLAIAVAVTGLNVATLMQVTRLPLGDSAATERRVGMQAQVGLELGRRAGPVDLGGPPLLGVVPEQGAAAGGST